MNFCAVGVKLDIYSVLEQKWNRSGTVIASENSSIKIKINGNNEEEVYYSLEEMLSLFLQNHVRQAATNGKLKKKWQRLDELNVTYTPLVALKEDIINFSTGEYNKNERDTRRERVYLQTRSI